MRKISHNLLFLVLGILVLVGGIFAFLIIQRRGYVFPPAQKVTYPPIYEESHKEEIAIGTVYFTEEGFDRSFMILASVQIARFVVVNNSERDITLELINSPVGFDSFSEMFVAKGASSVMEFDIEGKYLLKESEQGETISVEFIEDSEGIYR